MNPGAHAHSRTEGGQAMFRKRAGDEVGILIKDSDHGYGAFMEPSGRNQVQSVANAHALKVAPTAKTVATGCDQLPPEP
jgi:hypothetical protein